MSKPDPIIVHISAVVREDGRHTVSLFDRGPGVCSCGEGACPAIETVKDWLLNGPGSEDL